MTFGNRRCGQPRNCFNLSSMNNCSPEKKCQQTICYQQPPPLVLQRTLHRPPMRPYEQRAVPFFDCPSYEKGVNPWICCNPVLSSHSTRYDALNICPMPPYQPQEQTNPCPAKICEPRPDRPNSFEVICRPQRSFSCGPVIRCREAFFEPYRHCIKQARMKMWGTIKKGDQKECVKENSIWLGGRFISDVCTANVRKATQGIPCRFYTKAGGTLAGYFKRKPERKHDAGVYGIPCKDCNAVYIGQTIQGLKKRIQQHKYNVRKGDTASAIFNHISIHDHEVNFEGARMLVQEENLERRLTMEALMIKKEDHLMEGNKSNVTLMLQPEEVKTWSRIQDATGQEAFFKRDPQD